MCKLFRNRAKCSTCKEVVESEHRHDFKGCSCKRLYVDGGKDYTRRAFSGPYIELSEFEPCMDDQCPDKNRENEVSYENVG